MKNTAKQSKRKARKLGRRKFLAAAGAGAAAAAIGPHIWIPNSAIAQTSARGAIKHLLYIRLSGGFRFPTAFNAAVGDEFNPFGQASGVAGGTEWGVGRLLEEAPFLAGDEGMPLRDLGMRSVPEIANQITVLATVDHEPLSGSADGNHQTGLERYYTGEAGGSTGFFTMINYGLRNRFMQAAGQGEIILPSFVLGGSGMGRGLGVYAAHRPPVLSGQGFERFSLDSERVIPPWAKAMSQDFDARMLDRQHPELRSPVEAYIETRLATEAYVEIFNSDILKIANNSDEPIDGISNRELETMFGDAGAGRNLRLALRLFHFGSPAVYLDEGGYDLHSDEDTELPNRMGGITRMLSGLEAALKRMEHPTGGTYWDHTLVALGSEFSRTARGSRFNSAGGSDHGGDLATRWMSMPFMGGMIPRAGRQLGATNGSDLEATGTVYSYRSVLKTLMDGLGAEHEEFFPADPPFDDLFS
jgi:hypothetical protein